jgi:hypothetical protein
MRYGTHTLAIPNNAEHSVAQLKALLREVIHIVGRKISLSEWQGLS